MAWQQPMGLRGLHDLTAARTSVLRPGPADHAAITGIDDKSLATCTAKFNNLANFDFSKEPFMPTLEPGTRS
jgi:hypothetical protein